MEALEHALARDEVEVLRGNHHVSLKPGRNWMSVDGRRVDLPEAPLVSKEEQVLAVPVVPFAKALGVAVTADPKHFVTTFRFPLQEALDKVIPDEGAAAYDALMREAPGWVAAGTPYFSPQVQSWCANHHLYAPWFATADINGDGSTDVAVLLRKESRLALALIKSDQDPGPEVLLATDGPCLAQGAHNINSFVEKRGPGKVTCYTDGSKKKAVLNLQRPAFELVANGKPVELWYCQDVEGEFDSEGHLLPGHEELRHVILAD